MLPVLGPENKTRCITCQLPASSSFLQFSASYHDLGSRDANNVYPWTPPPRGAYALASCKGAWGIQWSKFRPSPAPGGIPRHAKTCPKPEHFAHPPCAPFLRHFCAISGLSRSARFCTFLHPWRASLFPAVLQRDTLAARVMPSSRHGRGARQRSPSRSGCRRAGDRISTVLLPFRRSPPHPATAQKHGRPYPVSACISG